MIVPSELYAIFRAYHTRCLMAPFYNKITTTEPPSSLPLPSPTQLIPSQPMASPSQLHAEQSSRHIKLQRTSELQIGNAARKLETHQW